MAKVAIVYHSGFGHTKVQAEAVHRGASRVKNVEAVLIPIEELLQVGGRHPRDSQVIDGVVGEEVGPVVRAAQTSRLLFQMLVRVDDLHSVNRILERGTDSHLIHLGQFRVAQILAGKSQRPEEAAGR